MLPPHLQPRRELEVRSGDLLFSRKNTIDLVGACTFVFTAPPRLLLPDTIFRFEFIEQPQVLPEYVWGVLNYPNFKKNVQSLAGGTAGSMPNISKEKLREVSFPIPPLSLQKKFADIAHKHEHLRNQQREALRQAEHLFQTLLARAFGNSG